MKWVVLTLLLIFLGKMALAETAIEKKVNSHLANTQSKIEIERAQREAELLRENRGIQVDPLATSPKSLRHSPERNTYNPDVSQKDPNVVSDHYNPQIESQDPAFEAQRDVSAIQEQRRQDERERREFIEEFKRRAKEAGVEVDINPKTLEANPR